MKYNKLFEKDPRLDISEKVESNHSTIKLKFIQNHRSTNLFIGVFLSISTLLLLFSMNFFRSDYIKVPAGFISGFFGYTAVESFRKLIYEDDC